LPTRFTIEPVVEVARRVLGTLRNVHSFFALYANIDGFDPRIHSVAVAERSSIDRWLISRLNTLIAYVDEELSRYEVTRASRAIQDFVVDDLSNWYVRRCRRRYWRHEMNKDKTAAYATLHETLVSLAKLIAPLVPFVAEEIYRHLVVPVDRDAHPSVHLCDYPSSDPGLVEADLEAAMRAVMRCVSLLRAARNRARIKVKQPLGSARLKIGDHVSDRHLEPLLEHLKDEVNVKKAVLEDDLSSYVSYEVLPRFDVLGPRLGDKVKALKQALASLDVESVGRLESGVPVKVGLDGDEIEVGTDDVTIRRTEKEGYLFETDGSNSIVLDTALTPELRAEGRAREIVSGIQNLRKRSGFDVTDNIKIYITGDELTVEAVRTFEEHIKSETLAVSVESRLPEGAEPVELPIDGQGAKVILEKV
jgi:isoleucyl-tRNA synthetase